MIIDEMALGQRFKDPMGDTWTFVARVMSHPLYPDLRMIIWRNQDGRWSHDALAGLMVVPDGLRVIDDVDLKANLRKALQS